MRSFAVVAALILSGCGPDCAPSGNIQVTISAGPGLDTPRVAMLRIVLSVDGMQPKTLDIPLKSPIASMPKTVLLQPDPAPAMKYNVALSVQALDSNGTVFALGTATADVVSNGCNRLGASLFPLGASGGDGGGGDGFIPPDLFSADLSNCTVTSASIPDEDQDNLADSCDLCPDDYDPTPIDSDLDGLPDACDPDPARPSNTLLYFDPFNANSGNWSGNFVLKPFPQGYWQIDTNGPQPPVASGNATVTLPSNVRIQAHVYSPGIYGQGGGAVDSDFGLFLGNNSNPGLTTTSGVLCISNANNQSGDALTIFVVTNGALVQPAAATTPIPNGWHNNVMYRLRLTQRGAVYTCELAANGMNPVTVTKTLAAAPSAPQFMALHAQAIEAHFHAVVAESVLP